MSWIDDYISEIDDVLANYDRKSAEDLVKRIRLRMNEEKARLKFNMRTYHARISSGGYERQFIPSDDDYIYDLERFRKRLLEVMDERSDRFSVHYQPSMNVSVHVDVANYIRIVNELPESTLSDEDKTALNGMLATLQVLEGEQKKSKVMEVVKWLGDKAVDVALIAIPAIASML